MSTYCDHADHADRAGLERRLRVLASAADRATMLRALEERDIGCVTLTMSAHELRAARLAGMRMEFWNRCKGGHYGR